MKAAISESLIINFLSCLLSLSKVAVTTSVLIGEEICNGPLKIWLILMLFNDAFYSFGLILIIKTIVTNDPNSFSRINNPRSRDSVSELDIDLSSVLRRNSFENEETNAFNINYGAERKNSLASRIMEITKL